MTSIWRKFRKKKQKDKKPKQKVPRSERDSSRPTHLRRRGQSFWRDWFIKY